MSFVRIIMPFVTKRMVAKRQQRLVSESYAITNREKLPGIAPTEDRVSRGQFRGRCVIRLGSGDRRVLNHEEDGPAAMERTQ